MTDEKLISWANLLKKGARIIEIIIGVGIVLALMFTIFIGNPSEIKQTFKTNKKIEKTIDSLNQDTKFIVERLYSIEQSQLQFLEEINNLQNGINRNNTGIIKLQKIYNAKINNANTYNVAQLDSFFTSRYKDYYNR